MNEKIHTPDELFSSLPETTPEDLNATIREARAAKADSVIVLDDDPTGTQTVHDIPVLTRWEADAIQAELNRDTPLFYILTNSRSLVAEKAEQLAMEIGRNIHSASRALGKKCMVISRSDSTLRGHYPAEVKALEKGLQIDDGVHFIIPAFFEGGRFTIRDVHYVKDGAKMIPAAHTPFAGDKVFGYRSSNLKEWVAEKTKGKIPAARVKSISLEDLRTKPAGLLLSKINNFHPGDVCIVNAADYMDLKKVAIAIFQSHIRPVCRTAASFVAALAAQEPKPLLTSEDLEITREGGSLIVVGSYVPKSTGQLRHLQQNRSLKNIELDVRQLLNGAAPEASVLVKTIDEQLREGKDVVLFTSRDLITTGSAKQNLEIGIRVSDYLTEIVSGISVRPRFILAKGGITSSDIATKSLQVKRAMVQGQIIAGVPVWQLGGESKFPGLSYIVFPGNVGDENSLTQVLEKLTI
jgi:uncharacterized protein YgbK (DUF1537 family)